jgi:PAS domain-containing protein
MNFKNEKNMVSTFDRLLETTENSFDLILVTDATVKGKIIYANKAFEKLTGHLSS